jgi:DNA helicase-2/ATP-dependent DNA helicase PcrA
VVFIPAVEQGTYPSYRCVEAHEVAEERRLLYVAMTRAQVFLVCPISLSSVVRAKRSRKSEKKRGADEKSITHCNMRMLGGEDSQKDLSEFVSKSRKQDPVSCPD